MKKILNFNKFLNEKYIEDPEYIEDMAIIDEDGSHGVSQVTIVPSGDDINREDSTIFWATFGATFIIATVALRRKYIRTDKVIAMGA